MIAVINMPLYDSDSDTNYYENYTLGSLQTISYSTHLDRKPIRKIGNVNAVDYVMGPRTIAGSLVFTVYDRHFADKIVADAKSKYGIKSNMLVDDLPPFDIIVNFANEYGSKSKITISGVRLINEGQVMSINDIYVENTYQFVATDLIYMDNDESKISSSSKRITAGPAPAIKSGEKPKPAPIKPPVAPGGKVQEEKTYPPLKGGNTIVLDNSIKKVPPSSYEFSNGIQFRPKDESIDSEMIQFVSINAEVFAYEKGRFPIKVSFEPERNTGIIKVLDFNKNEIMKQPVKNYSTVMALGGGEYYLKYEDENVFSDLKYLKLEKKESAVEATMPIIVNSTFGGSAGIENIPEGAVVTDENGKVYRDIRILRSDNRIENMKLGNKYYIKSREIGFGVVSENGAEEDYKVLIEKINNSSITEADKKKEIAMVDKAMAIKSKKEMELCEAMFSLNRTYESEFSKAGGQEKEYDMRVSAKLTGMLCTIFRNRIATVNSEGVFVPIIVDETYGIIGLNEKIDSLMIIEDKSTKPLVRISKSDFSMTKGIVSYVMKNIGTSLCKVAAYKEEIKVSPFVFLYSVDKHLYKRTADEKAYNISVNKKSVRITEELGGIEVRKKYTDIVYYNRELFSSPCVELSESGIKISVDGEPLLEQDSSYLVCVCRREDFGLPEFVSRKKINLLRKTAEYNFRDIQKSDKYLVWIEDIHGNEVSKCLYFSRDEEANYEYSTLKKYEKADVLKSLLAGDCSTIASIMIEETVNDSDINESNMLYAVLDKIAKSKHSPDKKMQIAFSVLSGKSCFYGKTPTFDIRNKWSIKEGEILSAKENTIVVYSMNCLSGDVSMNSFTGNFKPVSDKSAIHAVSIFDEGCFSISNVALFFGDNIKSALFAGGV